MLDARKPSRIRFDGAAALLVLSVGAGAGCSTVLGLDDYKIAGGTGAGGAGGAGATTSSGGTGGTGTGGNASNPGDVLSAAQTGDVSNLGSAHPPARELTTAFDTIDRLWCIASLLNGSVHLGDGTVVGAADHLQLACYEAAGTLIGSPQVTASAVTGFTSIGVDVHQGIAVLTAGFLGQTQLGGKAIGSDTGGANGMVMGFTVVPQLEVSAGPWNFGGLYEQWGQDVAFIPGTGNFVLLGRVDGPTSILGTNIDGKEDFFVARIDGASNVPYAITPPPQTMSGHQLGEAITAAPDGRAFFAGYYTAPFTLPTMPPTDFPAPAVSNDRDIFAVGLENNGDFAWAHWVQAGNLEYPAGVAIDAQNRRWMAMTLNAAPVMDVPPEAGIQCTFMDPPHVGLFAWDADGTPEVARCFSGMGFQMPTEIAADDAGNVFVVGYFGGSIDFGIKILTADGGNDAFVAKIDGAGNPVWAKQFAASMGGEALALGVGVDQAGLVHVMGTVRGDLIDMDTPATPISTSACDGGCEQLFFLTLAP